MKIISDIKSSSLPATNWKQVAVVSFCWVLLAGMIAFSPAHLCYDESDHMGLTQIVTRIGWHAALLSPDNRSAAGPLYPAIHIVLSPLTGLKAPAIRWINFIFLALVLLLLASRVLGSSLRQECMRAASILSVPFLWPSTGMALTELPALVAFTAFFILLLRVIDSRDEISPKSLTLACAAGICLGVSILGRQSYLAAIPIVGMIALWVPEKWPLLLICTVLATLSSGWLFVLWGSLSPPCYRQLAHSEICLANGVLALSYAGAATMFLNPGWMKLSSLRGGIACVGVGTAISTLTRDYSDPPAKTLLLRLLGGHLALPVGFLISAGLTILGVIWLWQWCNKIWERRSHPADVFSLLTLLGLVATPIKMTAQFSSRYIVGSLSIIFIVVGGPPTMGTWWAVRLLAGCLVGAAILGTYLH